MSLSVRTNEVKRIVNHICVMTTVHKPDDVRISKEIETLKKLGVKITFLAPEGNCPILGIEYVTLPVFKNRLSRMLFSMNKVFKLAATVNADIYHFHDPELIPVASKLKKIGKKIIYDVHENNPAAILNKEWLPSFSRKAISRIFEKLEDRNAKRFDGIVVVTEDQEKHFSSLSRTIVIPNYRKRAVNQSGCSIERDPKSRVRFVYAGSISRMTCIEEIINASLILWKESKDFEVQIAGPVGDTKLKRILEQVPEPIEYRGFLDRNEAEEMVKNSDVGFLLYSKEDKNALQCSPNKLFEYLSLGKPIIASDNAYWRQILDQRDSSLYVIDPSNPEEIAAKMRVILNSDLRIKKSLGSMELGKTFSWESIEGRLFELYESVLERK